MIRIQNILLAIAVILTMTALSSCVLENYDGCPDSDSDLLKDNWVTLQFIVSEETPGSRANPVGGESGNGREEEIFSEASIHDVNIFLFANNSSLLNATGGAKMNHLYFNLDDPGDGENTLAFIKETPSAQGNTSTDTKLIYTVKFRDEVPGVVLPLRRQGKVRIVTIANFGRSMKKELSKDGEILLRDLRDFDKLTATWSGSGQDISDGYDRFVMTTAYDDVDTDSYITFSNESGAGTESNPFRGKTTLQRMCARIDVMYGPDNLNNPDDKSELKYPVVDATGNEVHILNMLPVNVMAAPSYLFKKVTDVLPSEWTEEYEYSWGKRESTGEKGRPSNYVMERNTLAKIGLEGSELEQKLEKWYGDTKTSSVIGHIQNETKGKVGGYYHGPLKTKGAGLESYTGIAVLGYANENTQGPDQFNSNFLTGIAFRAIYFPKKIYKAYGETTDASGNKTLTEFDQSATEIPGGRIYRYSPSSGAQSESKSIYFTDRAAALRYSEDHPGEAAIISSDNTAFKAVKHGGKWGFICYYNLWLKHYDDVDDDNHSDPHEVFPMQYATVRNNIYRVALKFTGPGDPTATMREPETMQARIFVRKWNLRKETNALIF